ncbi:hypothetical protein SCLCIDRAFT_1225402 [Scleroderma citrinum Foug A]|uniref:Uncharacterized protein n=1 Tax=Scleroderma citrinum Foug A TaxID=1036808 RepID=A0A0C3D1T3_9AGAM|nr:hypothetical protein SCLCIDRAFT_1225402 [Scleroderma citrinum Foug A]
MDKFGDSAAVRFICIVHSSVSALLRPNRNARWTVGHGISVYTPHAHGYVRPILAFTITAERQTLGLFATFYCCACKNIPCIVCIYRCCDTGLANSSNPRVANVNGEYVHA